MTNKMVSSPLLSCRDVAGLLNLSTATIRTRRWRFKHNLVSVRIGRSVRFRISDVERLIQKGIERGRTELN